MEDYISKAINKLRQVRDEHLESAKKAEKAIAALEEYGDNGSRVTPAADDAGPVQGVISVAAPRTHLVGRYAGKTVAEAAVEFLRSLGTPQKTRTIANALEMGGLQSSDMYRAVFNALDVNAMTVKSEGKRWALREWSGN